MDIYCLLMIGPVAQGLNYHISTENNSDERGSIMFWKLIAVIPVLIYAEFGMILLGYP